MGFFADRWWVPRKALTESVGEGRRKNYANCPKKSSLQNDWENNITSKFSTPPKSNFFLYSCKTKSSTAKVSKKHLLTSPRSEKKEIRDYRFPHRFFLALLKLSTWSKGSWNFEYPNDREYPNILIMNIPNDREATPKRCTLWLINNETAECWDFKLFVNISSKYYLIKGLIKLNAWQKAIGSEAKAADRLLSRCFTLHFELKKFSSEFHIWSSGSRGGI